jgi:hypothetical protein
MHGNTGSVRIQQVGGQYAGADCDCHCNADHDRPALPPAGTLVPGAAATESSAAESKLML